MKEFIEKLIGRLEEKFKYNSEQAEIYRDGSDKDAYFREKKDLYMDRANTYGQVMRIINELAEEYGKDTNVTTNADRIRSMTDEELAEFLYDTNHYFENDRYLVRFGGEIVQDEEISILDWLQSEVEGVTENE